MMYEDILVKVKVHGANKVHYQNIINKYIKFGDVIEIAQLQLPLTSRVKVLCKCELCDNNFYRVRKDVKETTLCSAKCRNAYFKTVNPNLNALKHKVNCESCNVEFEVLDSKFKKQQYFLCSRECYKKHRSNYYAGNKLYNYQNEFVKCCNTNCNNKVKTSDYYKKNKIINSVVRSVIGNLEVLITPNTIMFHNYLMIEKKLFQNLWLENG